MNCDKFIIVSAGFLCILNGLGNFLRNFRKNSTHFKNKKKHWPSTKKTKSAMGVEFFPGCKLSCVASG